MKEQKSTPSFFQTISRVVTRLTVYRPLQVSMPSNLSGNSNSLKYWHCPFYYNDFQFCLFDYIPSHGDQFDGSLWASSFTVLPCIHVHDLSTCLSVGNFGQPSKILMPNLSHAAFAGPVRRTCSPSRRIRIRLRSGKHDFSQGPKLLFTAFAMVSAVHGVGKALAKIFPSEFTSEITFTFLVSLYSCLNHVFFYSLCVSLLFPCFGHHPIMVDCWVIDTLHLCLSHY